LFLVHQKYGSELVLQMGGNHKKLDCSGLCCSLPLVEARTESDKMEAGQTLEVIANCPSAEEDMQILTRKEGFELGRKWKEDDRAHFLINKL
jgi:TusA-related sulfurtransferase